MSTDEIRVLDQPDDSTLAYVPGVAPLDAATWARHAPARHLVATRDGVCVGRCSIWTSGAPLLDGGPIGVVGHYAASDAAAGTALLTAAEAAVAVDGFTRLVGPMDGNTWRPYRLVTRRAFDTPHVEPPFFLEPDNPDDWPSHFAAAGFAPLATYFSSLNDDLTVVDPRVPDALQRLAADGVRLRTIDLSRYDAELRAIHSLSVEAFANNFLYTPIAQDEFLATYAPLRELLRPDLILLAERGGELIGFLFGVPDLLETRRCEPARTAIAKSMAVRTGRTGAGLGSVLMDRFQQAARAAGFTRVIHALMHEGNRSLNISHRYGRPVRQYTLLAKAVSR